MASALVFEETYPHPPELVWRALTEIPRGETRTYADVARAIGSPAAVRAVARACATNPVALVVPCHRVIGSDGKLHGYRWGLDVKKRLIERELAEAGRANRPPGAAGRA